MSAQSLNHRPAARFTPYNPADPEQAAMIADYDGDMAAFLNDETMACERCDARWFVGSGRVDVYQSPFSEAHARHGEWFCEACEAAR